MASKSRGDSSPLSPSEALTTSAPEPISRVLIGDAMSRWLVGNAQLLLLLAAAVAALGLLPETGPSAVENIAPGPYHPAYPLALIIAGCGLAYVGMLRRVALVLVPIGLFVAAFALGVLEDRSLSAIYHRSVPRPLGITPDLLLLIAWAFVLAARGHARERDSRAWGGGALVATVVYLVFLLGPAPVAGEFTPGISALVVDTVDTGERFGRAVLPWLNAAMGAGTLALSLAHGLRQRLRWQSLTAAFVGWALLSGLFGSEGWHLPLWHWPVLLHAVTRVAVLSAILAASFCLLARLRPGDEDAHALLSVPRNRNVLAGAICLAALVVGMEAWHWSKADENIYFYAAEALTDGILPYRDYFYAHPPLRVLLPGLLFVVFGFSKFTALLLPVVAPLVSGLCIWRITARITGANRGEVAGLLAMGLFLASERVLNSAGSFNGVNASTACACLALWFAVSERHRWAGVTAAVAVSIGMIQLWMLPVIALTLWLRARRSTPGGAALRPLVVGFGPALGLGLLGLFGTGLALGGGDFITQAFEYHALKPPTEPNYVAPGANPLNWPLAVITDVGLLFSRGALRVPANSNPLAWLGAILGPLLLLWMLWRQRGARSEEAINQSKNDAVNWLPLLAGLVLSLVFIALLRERYTFYWAALMPVPAMLAAIGLCRGARWLQAHPRGGIATVVLLVLFPTRAVEHWGLAVPNGPELLRPGKVKPMDFRSSAPLQASDGLLASVFFKPYLVRGEIESPSDRFFWSRKKEFSIAEEVARAVVELTPEGRPITGSSTIAPLVALLAERRMASNEVDTNNKVFVTGLRDETEFWRTACDDGLAAVIAAGGFFPERKLQNSPVRGQFRVARRFQDPKLRWGSSFRMSLWVLRDDLERCTVP